MKFTLFKKKKPEPAKVPVVGNLSQAEKLILKSFMTEPAKWFLELTGVPGDFQLRALNREKVTAIQSGPFVVFNAQSPIGSWDLDDGMKTVCSGLRFSDAFTMAWLENVVPEFDKRIAEKRKVDAERIEAQIVKAFEK